MTQKEILVMEERASSDGLYKMFVTKSGGWYHMNEWSAYLAFLYQNKYLKEVRSNVINKKSKEVTDGFIQIGFPCGSFEKFLPNLKCPDGKTDLYTFDVKDYIENVFSLETYKDILAGWKSKYPIEDFINKKKNEEVKEEISYGDFDSIISDILRYPITEKSLIDNTVFLSSIRDRFIATFLK